MTLRSTIANLAPMDAQEKEQIESVLRWIDSDREIYRISKPATPPIHLAAYFVLIDSEKKQILLARHKKAAHLWLPTGGHVEKEESPLETVIRECEEELRMHAEFLQDDPLFLSLTKTIGEAVEHTHISLWYILKANASCDIDFDKEELHAVHWFDLDKIPFELSYPDLQKFCIKLGAIS